MSKTKTTSQTKDPEPLSPPKELPESWRKTMTNHVNSCELHSLGSMRAIVVKSTTHSKEQRAFLLGLIDGRKKAKK